MGFHEYAMERCSGEMASNSFGARMMQSTRRPSLSGKWHSQFSHDFALLRLPHIGFSSIECIEIWARFATHSLDITPFLEWRTMRAKCRALSTDWGDRLGRSIAPIPFVISIDREDYFDRTDNGRENEFDDWTSSSSIIINQNGKPICSRYLIANKGPAGMLWLWLLPNCVQSRQTAKKNSSSRWLRLINSYYARAQSLMCWWCEPIIVLSSPSIALSRSNCCGCDICH